MAYEKIEPVPGPEAFEDHSYAGQLSQAALVLSAGAAVCGRGASIDHSERFPLPDLTKVRSTKRLPVAQASCHLDLSPSQHAQKFIPEVANEQAPRLARQLYDQPEPERATSLIESALHSPHQVVRVAAASAALDTTRSRHKLREILEEGVGSDDELIREVAATSLARVDPTNSRLAGLVGSGIELKKSDKPSHTAALTHGTWGPNQPWYKPGGDFYHYLSGIAPSLNVHGQSFQWSGAYSHQRRLIAAQELSAWVASQNLIQPDFFAHSHGATVANLATRAGLRFKRLVWLAWPVHHEWLPDFTKVAKVIDIRVRFDLVITADRGGQRINPGYPVTEHIHGWFSHPAPHESGYWNQYGLDMAL